MDTDPERVLNKRSIFRISAEKAEMFGGTTMSSTPTTARRLLGQLRGDLVSFYAKKCSKIVEPKRAPPFRNVNRICTGDNELECAISILFLQQVMGDGN